MSIEKVIIAICSILFLTVGVDKFYAYLEPPCSFADVLPPMLWKIFGVLQLIAGILIWIPRFRKFVVGFFFLFMLTFTIAHLANGTYDIGGAAFMAVALGLLLWNPSFIRSKAAAQ